MKSGNGNEKNNGLGDLKMNPSYLFNPQVDGHQNSSNFVPYGGPPQAFPYYPWAWTPWGSNPYQWVPPVPNQWPPPPPPPVPSSPAPLPSNTSRSRPLNEAKLPSGQRNEKGMSDNLSSVEPNHGHSQSPPIAHPDVARQMLAERNEKQKSHKLSPSEK